MATQDKCVTIAPYFKVHEGKMPQLKALCERFVEKSSTESGCLYYGFSFKGDEAFCREGYRDADAALAHLANVGALLTELLVITDLTRFEVHGVESELAKLRGPLAQMNPQYFVLDCGFRRA
jgi:quinol monooxygenase YgiN